MKFHGYCTLMSPEAMKLPYLEAFASWARLCESLTVVYSRFPKMDLAVPRGAVAPWEDDGSLELLHQFNKDMLNNKLNIVEHTWDPNEPREDGFTKQISRTAAMTKAAPEDWLCQFDADEILRDNDELKILELASEDEKAPFDQRRAFMTSGILELFGSRNQVRFGFSNWLKIRITRNIPELQHGMPLRLGEMAVRGRNPRTNKIIAIDNRDDGAGFITTLSMTRPDYNMGIWLFNPNILQMAAQARQLVQKAPDQNQNIWGQVVAALQQDLDQGGVWMYHTGWQDIARKWRMGWFWDNAWSLLSGKQDTFIEKAAMRGSFTHTHAPEGEALQAEIAREMARPEIQTIQVDEPSVFNAVTKWRAKIGSTVTA